MAERMDHQKLLERAREASRTGAKSAKEPAGFVQTTIPVPKQQRAEAFPVNHDPGRLVIGEVRLCPRCRAYRGKRFREFGYYVDPEPERPGQRCRRCNGWGYIPNQGI